MEAIFPDYHVPWWCRSQLPASPHAGYSAGAPGVGESCGQEPHSSRGRHAVMPAAASGATGRDSPERWAPGAVKGEAASYAGGRKNHKNRKDRKDRKERKRRDRSRSRSGDQQKHGNSRREKRRRSPSSSPSGGDGRHSRKREGQDAAEQAPVAVPGVQAEAELREAVLMSMRARQLEEEARARAEAETRADVEQAVEQAVLTVEAAPACLKMSSWCQCLPRCPGVPAPRDGPAAGCRLALRALR